MLTLSLERASCVYLDAIIGGQEDTRARPEGGHSRGPAPERGRPPAIDGFSFDAATALDTVKARVDPRPTLLELLVRHVLLPREFLLQIEINSTVSCAKKTLALIDHIAQQCSRRGTHLHRQAQDLTQEIKKVMRAFGRSCRGQSHVFVKLVRQTEHQLLALGEPIATFGQKAKEYLAQATSLSATRRQRLSLALTAALSNHAHIRTQSKRLTQGKKLETVAELPGCP
jgi:hypothetical protein